MERQIKYRKLHLRGVNRTPQATSTHMLPGSELRDHVSVGQNYAVSDKLEQQAQVPSTCLSPPSPPPPAFLGTTLCPN